MIIDPPDLDALRSLSRCDDYAERDPRVLVAPLVIDVLPLIDQAMRVRLSRSASDVAELLAARGISRRVVNAALLLLVGHGYLEPLDGPIAVSLDELRRCPIRSVTRSQGRVVVDYYVLIAPLRRALPTWGHGSVTPPSREPALPLLARVCAELLAHGAAKVRQLLPAELLALGAAKVRQLLLDEGHDASSVDDAIARAGGRLNSRVEAIAAMAAVTNGLSLRVPELLCLSEQPEPFGLKSWERARAFSEVCAIAGPGNVREAGDLLVRAFDAIGGPE